MKWYKLLHDTESTILKTSAGCQVYGEKQLDAESYEAVFGFDCEREYPTGLVVKCLILDDSVEVSDFLSVGSLICGGLLMSINAYDVLKRMDVPNVAFFEAPVNSSSGIIDCKLMLFTEELFPKIDIQKSTFLKFASVFARQSEKCKFSTLEDLLESHRSVAGIGKIVPDGKYQLTVNYENFKVLRIGEIDESIYVSEDYVKGINQIGLTGLKFVESDLFG